MEQGAGKGFAVHVQRWNIAGNILLKGVAVLLDLKTIRIKCGANEFREVRLFEFVFLTACLDTGEIKDIVDESGETLTLFANNAKVFLVLFLRGQTAEFERLGIKPNESERRAQLVRNVRDKVRLQSSQIHFAGNIAIGKEHPARHDQREGSKD